MSSAWGQEAGRTPLRPTSGRITGRCDVGFEDDSHPGRRSAKPFDTTPTGWQAAFMTYGIESHFTR
ncbi:hypothetical protein ABZ128_13285 [Streptomyces sp. NPDC006326]|uniref:hypothetical protein n=1 Tax=Streptomyces sp. NPDC006326 TaxID=3156752 RepID=UPI0033A41329